VSPALDGWLAEGVGEVVEAEVEGWVTDEDGGCEDDGVLLLEGAVELETGRELKGRETLELATLQNCCERFSAEARSSGHCDVTQRDISRAKRVALSKQITGGSHWHVRYGTYLGQ
jgi:hypothetical protein